LVEWSRQISIIDSTVILSRAVVQGCDLRCCVVDGVVDTGVSGCLDPSKIFPVEGAFGVPSGSAGWVRAVLAEGFSQGDAESAVVDFEPAAARGGGFETLPQGGVGGSLAVGDDRLCGGPTALAEPFDLGAELGLVVEPRS
jgi:hypothetical protein